MTTTSTLGPPRRLTREQREQLVLDTAARLFYARGVHEVGMDELVHATGLGKATVYRLFPTKDALVGAYLSRHAAAIFTEIDRAAGAGSAGDALRAVLSAVRADLQREQFRGCAFNNASIEFDDPQHPARIVAREYRRDLHDRLVVLARQLLPGRRAHARRLGAQLAVLIDGAYTNAAHLGPAGPADEGLRLAGDLVRRAERGDTGSGSRDRR